MNCVILDAGSIFTAESPAGTIVSVGSLGRASMMLEDPKLLRTPRTSLTRRFCALFYVCDYNIYMCQNTIDRWTMGCILPLSKKGDLGLAKNYRGIIITSIAAKIYNALLRNCIEPKIDNILRKNQNGFRRNRSMTSHILTMHQILVGVCAKNLQALILFINFAKAFDEKWSKYYSPTANPKKPSQP